MYSLFLNSRLGFFIFYYYFKIFIVIQLQLYAFSPHPSTPPQPFYQNTAKGEWQSLLMGLQVSGTAPRQK